MEPFDRLLDWIFSAHAQVAALTVGFVFFSGFLVFCLLVRSSAEPLVYFIARCVSRFRHIFRKREPVNSDHLTHQNGDENDRLIAGEVTTGDVNEVAAPPTMTMHMHARRVGFCARYLERVQPNTWQTLYVYNYNGLAGLNQVRQDFIRRANAPVQLFAESVASANALVSRGTEIMIQPELTDFIVNPPRSNMLLLEDWHCCEFRLKSKTSAPVNEPIKGRICFYVGPILIAEIVLSITLVEELPSYVIRFVSEQWASPYRSIFVSYSHRDAVVIDQLEQAYKALGDSYLRDVRLLRSGEKWNPALLKKIEEADIFQLCWSHAARKSKYVKQEWKHALKLERDNFVRPVYWQEPIPPPPRQLKALHFAYLPIDDGR